MKKQLFKKSPWRSRIVFTRFRCYIVGCAMLAFYINPLSTKAGVNNDFVVDNYDLASVVELRPNLEQLIQDSWVLNGQVTDERGEPFYGATVKIKNSTRGTATDVSGKFVLEIKSENDSIIVAFMGYSSQTIRAGNSRSLSIQLQPDAAAQELDQAVVVGFGTQKKASMVSSITTINPKELKGPTSNLTSMLAGRVSGMIAYQRSGEPGADNAQFFIRGLGSFGAGKRDPLILIDGIESSSNDMARLQPDDIASFSVLKDATASAVYGARGANGVVLITTKTGVDGSTKFDLRVENNISSNAKNFKFADNITYMNLANEAALTRDPLSGLPYSQTKIDHTAAGDNPLLYPNNNWIDQMIKDYTINQRYNLSVSGGAKKAQYYIAGTYNIDNGILEVDKRNNFNNNIKLKNYSVRSNVNLHFTSTTEAIVRVYGQFDDYNGPVGGGGNIFNQAIWSNPVMFPAVYPSQYSPHTQHPLFGNALMPGTSVLFSNPYANTVRGYSESNTSTMQAQLELKQNLGFVTEGLSARAMAYTKRYAHFSVSRQYDPFFYTASEIDGVGVNIRAFNDGGPSSIGIVGTEYLNYGEGPKIVNTSFYAEGSINYARDFKEHAVSGMLIGIMNNYLTGNAGNLQASLPHRNLGLSGRFTYGYDTRYLMEFNFGLNGSERFAEDNRWGFFPSIGLGWVMSNERFFVPIKSVVSNLKLRATYGLVGNDEIGNPADRFFYLANVNMQAGDRGSTFGEEFSYYRPGVSISRYANERIGWENSEQLNLGADISLFGSVNIVADAFRQVRSNILMGRSYIPTTMGLQAAVVANVGKSETQGVDLSIDYNKSFGKNWWVQGRGNFTYATSKILTYDEPVWGSNQDYLYRAGQPVGQVFGYISERLFVDDTEVANSPRQNFGEYMGGDIKYRDMNGDGEITGNDMVPLGYPTTPEIIYGFGWSVGYKGFDFSAFLQGSARSSFWINPGNISPFVLTGSNQNGLLKVIADDYWSEDNKNNYAFWPRLSDKQVQNNNQTSTWWMRNGAFLRVKTIEAGYNFSQNLLNRLGFRSARIYVNTSNPFVISNFKMWDPEMGGDGLGYPIQTAYNVGINFGL